MRLSNPLLAVAASLPLLAALSFAQGDPVVKKGTAARLLGGGIVDSNDDGNEQQERVTIGKGARTMHMNRPKAEGTAKVDGSAGQNGTPEQGRQANSSAAPPRSYVLKSDSTTGGQGTARDTQLDSGTGISLEEHVGEGEDEPPPPSLRPVPAIYAPRLQDAWRLAARTGDYGPVQQLLREGLNAYPNDPGFTQYSRLVETRVKKTDGAALSRRIDALAQGTRRLEDGGVDLAGLLALSGQGTAPQAALVAGRADGFFAAPRGADPRVVAAAGTAAQAAPGAVVPASTELREAARLLRLDDNAGAERALLRRLERDPKDAPALSLLALTYFKQERHEDALRMAGLALKLNPRDVFARQLRVKSLLALQRYPEAQQEADEALALQPLDAYLLALRGDAKQGQGLEEEALTDYKAAADLDPEFAALYADALRARDKRVSRAPSGLPPALGRRPALLIGAAGTALLFFSFLLYRRRGDTTGRVALRQNDHDAAVAVAPRVDAVPQGFSVVRTLGAGGMGVVYEAVDLALQRTVALKKMRDEIAANPRERARFLKEARLVAGLRHPHIVEIYSIHENEDGLFLVFERVPGVTLSERLERGPVPVAETLALLRQVASALDHAHAAGVVHQDLKPANIMVHAGAVKVMDFGIARRVQETLSTMSRVEVIGTPAYMSPEQEQGGSVGPAADLFALGVCAYQMLTGRLPFPHGGLAAKAQGLYRPATDGTPLPRAVDGELGRALSPLANGRHGSASAFVDALGRALS